jgi:hypothetical protein
MEVFKEAQPSTGSHLVLKQAIIMISCKKSSTCCVSALLPVVPGQEELPPSYNLLSAYRLVRLPGRTLVKVTVVHLKIQLVLVIGRPRNPTSITTSS